MIQKGLLRKTSPFLAVLLIKFFIPPASALAAWYFTWSCSSPIGSPGGREGPYADKSACESDLSRARSACQGAGGSFSGWCSGSDDYGPAPGYQQPAPDWGEIQRRQEEERRRQEEQRRRLEQERQRREAEEEAKRREEEARERFERSKQEALELMKGTGSDTLTIKPGTEFFGIKGTPEGGLKIKSGIPEEAANRAVMAWACAGWIADFAFSAARKGDVGEVRFLKEEVRRSLSGEKPGVDCPKISPPPDVKGVAIGPDSPGARFYDALIKAVSLQSENLVQARGEMAKYLGKKQVTDEDIRKLEEELKTQEKARPVVEKKERVEGEKEKEKPKQEVKPAAEAKEGDDSLALALAALKKAQEAKKKIDEYESMHKKVQASPSLAEKLIDMVGK